MLFEKHGDEIAGVILEPVAMNMGVIEPDPEFLKTLRKLCDEYNSVLIYDEVKTCGKWFGGAEERYGVKPDLKTLGKAIGGGIPLSAIGGRREIMELFGPGKVSHAGTFNANPLSVKAGIITLEKILTRDALDRARRLGEQLAN
ncbi:MAG: aminotransferase class III-fold pyridoxal phosphate-dependent enzyme, partial [Nitrososphaerota archaeon]